MNDLFSNDDDVGIEVMSRLPFSSLLIFRNINKSWRHIIDSSFFRKLHIEKQLSSNNHHNDDDPLLLILFLGVREHQFFQELSIMHLHTHKSYNHCFYKVKSLNPIALCNPSLREIKILPSSPSLDYHRRVVGLGYDDLQKDYKIVQFVQVDKYRPSHLAVEVYSRKRNTWRRVLLLADHKGYSVWKPLQHAEPSSGAVAHWKGMIDGTIDAIFPFDMRSDALKVMKITCGGYWKILKNFAKENSSFKMFAYPDDYGGPRRVMIILEYKGGEWIKAGKLGPFFELPWLPVTIWKSDGLIFKIYSREQSMLVLCDITSGEVVKRFEFSSGLNCNLDYIEYRGSFISP